MVKKIKVGIIFGGKSSEHEVALQSAKNIINAIDRKKYELVLIGVDKNGKWLLGNESNFLLNSGDPKLIALNKNSKEVVLKQGNSELVRLEDKQSSLKLDVIFPVFHGPLGEDGTIQGLLKLANIPFVGADVLGSAIGMDKDVMKRLLKEAGVPVAKFRVAHRSEKNEVKFKKLVKELGLPFFIKPANLGSSVGVSKIKKETDFKEAIEEAFKYDNKILIEEYINGREIECSVLGNENPIASLPGEIIPQGEHEFYDYEAKYIDEDGAVLIAPIKLPEDITKRIQDLAIKAFKTLCCEGMARADFFLKENGQVFVSEINTIPGFTKISMYPKLWEASGISYTVLIDRLIELALERYERDKKLKTSYT